MNAFIKFSAATLIAIASTGGAIAQEHGSHAGHGAAHAGQQAAAVELTDGEIKKVDKETGKITIRHGELRNLGMAPMTMVFRAKDPAMLGQVKAGDKVKFAAERVNGAITVVQIAPAT
ncbi:MAG: copper-binding protein [Telluria sp.]